jgi:menaquinone-specific isochorismate synthase
VAGRVSNGVSVVDVRDALHPTPALAGYPVRSSIAAIRQIEDFNRGLYGGPIGYVDLRGDGEFSVAIRSGVFCRDFGYVYAGCGIVEGSDPSAEYDELDAKLKTILDAFQEADDE